MERHPAMPDIERLQRVRRVIARHVEQDIAEASAEDDAERGPHQEIIDVLAADQIWRPAGQRQAIAPADQQPDNIGERVPADRERAERDRDRVDRRERDRKSGICLPIYGSPDAPVIGKPTTDCRRRRAVGADAWVGGCLMQGWGSRDFRLSGNDGLLLLHRVCSERSSSG